MALHIVELHPNAPQKWAYEWVDDRLLKVITTPRRVADELESARVRGERVYVHCCAHGREAAVVCCSGIVESVAAISRSDALVRLTDLHREDLTPSVQPMHGQSSYSARDP